uniref:Uncharacterized protein n=1 Tax=Brassica oleracea TaxID=3712 RepID=A0A3P6GEU9_BRAOL|nr:unnamed protein product [Brassica oleracea]
MVVMDEKSTLIHTSISVNRLNQNFWLWECHVSIRFTEHTKFVELAATINLIPLEMFWFCTYDHYLLLLLLTPIYQNSQPMHSLKIDRFVTTAVVYVPGGYNHPGDDMTGAGA